RKLDEAVQAGKVRIIFQSSIKEFGDGTYRLEIQEGGRERTEELPYAHAFVLIGAELPTDFLRSLGIQLENDWTGNPALAAALTAAALCSLWIAGGHTGVAALAGWRLGGTFAALATLTSLLYSGIRGSRFAWLGLSFLVSYTIYGIKQGDNLEFWPYQGWGHKALSIFHRPWSFWYTVLYTVVMT